ncbi:MAG: hypothetical protein Q7N50_11885 [Armatimonadota bacterium]|nr:hypothetical protein [Armatimonadota bacterium]
MIKSIIRAVAIYTIMLLACAVQVWALPAEVAIESNSTKLIISLSDGQSLLKSITNKGTGEVITFADESPDFILTTDKDEFKRSDFKITDVIQNGNSTFVVMDNPALAVTERYEAFGSGCIKRSLQIFPKTALFVERVSLINLKLNEKPTETVTHNARFLVYPKGGVFMTVEMPESARWISLGKEDGYLRTSYEPVLQMKPGDSMETVPAVFCSWIGAKREGYECYRDYSYELSRWRKYATVRTSSESPTNLTTAYDGYKAVDDDISTRWRTANALDGTHWLEIEFPQTVTFNTMAMLLDNEDARPALDKPAPIGQYHLQIWVGDGWKDIASGYEATAAPVKFLEVKAGKARLLIEGCHGRFSLWDLRLYNDTGNPYVIPENVCSRFWIDQGVHMPFTYFNTWYIKHTGVGRLARARGMLTYDKTLPLIPLAAECGLEHFVLDAGWKYLWSGVGLNPGWKVEFPNGEKPFTDAADNAGIDLSAWFYFFWLEGKDYDHQWRVVNKDGKISPTMCLLSGYYNFAKNEMLSQIRNSHMKMMKIDGFVPVDECYATNHNHKPGNIRDAEWLGFMRLVEEIKRQYPDFLITPYTWDGFWVKYSELIHTYQDHGGLTPLELAPTRAKMNYMHDREMFNEAYWRYLVRNQVEGSAIITDKTPEWREELIGNLAGPTRRQISTNLPEFTADERNWIRDCMNWSRKNAKYLEQFKPFFPNPNIKEPWGLPHNRGMEKQLGVDVLESNTLEGYAHISDNEGYIFIFNPTFHDADYSVPISKGLGFTASARGLSFQTIYPYLENLISSVKFGDEVKGYLPAEKYIIVKVSKQPIPTLAADCRYVANETIWDSVNMSLRAAPTTSGGMVKTKLTPPTGTVFEELAVNGKAIAAGKDGSYEITLQAPIRGSVASKKDVKITNGKKITTANVSVSGDLLEPSLMLFLYRTSMEPNKNRLTKAEPGELAYRILIDGKPLQGAYGETLEKDWETEKDAGWWIFRLPVEKRKFTVTVETSEKVKPALLFAAKQDSKEAVIVGKYARGVSKALLTNEDKEVFFHQFFPDEKEYFPIIDLTKE